MMKLVHQQAVIIMLVHHGLSGEACPLIWTPGSELRHCEFHKIKCKLATTSRPSPWQNIVLSFGYYAVHISTTNDQIILMDKGMLGPL